MPIKWTHQRIMTPTRRRLKRVAHFLGLSVPHLLEILTTLMEGATMEAVGLYVFFEDGKAVGVGQAPDVDTALNAVRAASLGEGKPDRWTVKRADEVDDATFTRITLTVLWQNMMNVMMLLQGRRPSAPVRGARVQ